MSLIHLDVQFRIVVYSQSKSFFIFFIFWAIARQRVDYNLVSSILPDRRQVAVGNLLRTSLGCFFSGKSVASLNVLHNCDLSLYIKVMISTSSHCFLDSSKLMVVEGWILLVWMVNINMKLLCFFSVIIDTYDLVESWSLDHWDFVHLANVLTTHSQRHRSTTRDSFRTWVPVFLPLVIQCLDLSNCVLEGL